MTYFIVLSKKVQNSVKCHSEIKICLQPLYHGQNIELLPPLHNSDRCWTCWCFEKNHDRSHSRFFKVSWDISNQSLKDLGIIIPILFAPQLTCFSFPTSTKIHEPLSHVGLLLSSLRIIFLNREETNEKLGALLSLHSLVIWHNVLPTGALSFAFLFLAPK